MTHPEPRQEVTTWYAVTDPARCAGCGHDHYGWLPARGAGVLSCDWSTAPQWAYCDQPDCPCRSLQREPR